MVRREPPTGRRQPLREPHLRLLVVCGTEKTETAYLKGLRAVLGANSVDIKIVERPRSPDQVVEHTRDHRNYRDFDECWCVLDVDAYEQEGGKVTIASSKADEAGIRLAVSNPCFEYWLLLHYRKWDRPFARCKEVLVPLRRSVPSYDKARLRFTDFANGVSSAIAQAKQRDPSAKDFAVNPSSSVWVLVERLMEQRGSE
jgi:hypothetical protein